MPAFSTGRQPSLDIGGLLCSTVDERKQKDNTIINKLHINNDFIHEK